MIEETTSSTHPPLLPTTEDDRVAWLRLLRSRRVGISTFYRLLKEHGTAQNALLALPDVARAAGVKDYEICPIGVIDAELKKAKRAHARLLCLGDDEYPEALASISDAPPLLWAIGNTSLFAAPDDRAGWGTKRLVSGHQNGTPVGPRPWRKRLYNRIRPRQGR